MTDQAPAVVTSELLARKGSATSAGFKYPPAPPPQPVGINLEHRGIWPLVMWLIPAASIAVAVTLVVQLVPTDDETEIVDAIPVGKSITKIEAPVPPPKKFTAVAIPKRRPPAPRMKVVKAAAKIQPPVATKPIYRVQLHALGSRELARREWRRLKSSHGDLFHHKKLTLLSAKYDVSGVGFVRLQVGPFSGFSEARRLCKRAKKRRLPCMVVQQ